MENANHFALVTLPQVKAIQAPAQDTHMFTNTPVDRH